MGEWASYGLSDFLMFAPSTYWRLVERYNQAAWPGQVVAVAFGVALLGPARRGTGARAGLLILAAAWAWCGWAFHWQRYAEIFLGATMAAWACWVQALLLLAAAFLRPDATARGAPALERAGWLLVAIGVLFYWIPAAWTAPPWVRAEVFGFMPDPTALATLGWLLAAPALRPWLRAGLAVIPTLSLLLGALTRVAMA
jgi:hypothetical protein